MCAEIQLCLFLLLIWNIKPGWEANMVGSELGALFPLVCCNWPLSQHITFSFQLQLQVVVSNRCMASGFADRAVLSLSLSPEYLLKKNLETNFSFVEHSRSAPSICSRFVTHVTGNSFSSFTSYKFKSLKSLSTQIKWVLKNKRILCWGLNVLSKYKASSTLLPLYLAVNLHSISPLWSISHSGLGCGSVG